MCLADREKQKELERIDKEDERGRQILKQLHSIELAARSALAIQPAENSKDSDDNCVHNSDLIEAVGNCQSENSSKRWV